ncbi:ribosome assembly RNA-binding protein YhbY [Stenoxybacter acetivorans]|uniref:ribosome assembly RNA-binding protein YhbY n=1 Tax=Stenoxybacter acetivorans TaxID=422441 RepID=UPI000566BFAF|nr:ribosome assembly RNA-binding protein YhbY [Stenoxybacter acetivorans]
MTEMLLSTKDIAALKARAHHLNPVVMIGQNGLTDAVIQETDTHLTAHELIKVQVADDDRAERAAIAQALCGAVDAHLVQHIGKQLVLFRPKPEKPQPK